MEKVLYVLKEPYPWDVRAEKICNSLAVAGFDVFLLSLWKKGLSEKEKSGKINIIRAGYKRPGIFSLPVSLNPFWKSDIEKAVKELEPDIIIPREIMLAEACGKIGNKNGIPVIMDMAENYPAAMKLFKKYNSNFALKFIIHNMGAAEKFEEKSLPLMDGIITVCKEQNERLHEQYGCSPSQMQVVHNTPQKNWFMPAKKRTDKNVITFGHHGHLTGDKRLDIFLRGFLLAARKHRNIELLLAGGRECFNDLKNIAANSEFSQRVHLTGPYEFSELSGILNRIDIGVLPYLANDFNNYTIHNKLFDFFAAGIPVMVSNAKPVSRVVEETNTGISGDCSTPEKVSQLIDSMLTKDLNKFSKNGIKAFNKTYNWENDEKNLIRFIKKYI